MLPGLFWIIFVYVSDLRFREARYCTIVGCGTVLQARRSRVRFSRRLLHFFNLSHPFSRTIAMGSTQPLTGMSIRTLPGGKRRQARQMRAPCPGKLGVSTFHNTMGLNCFEGWIFWFCFFRISKSVTYSKQLKGIMDWNEVYKQDRKNALFCKRAFKINT
jgi:hypothetical protein